MTVTINHMGTRRNSKTKAKAIGICLRTGNAAMIIYPYKSSAPLSYSHTALNCRFTLQERSQMGCSSSSHSFTVLHVNTGNGF